ncbi:hypothetical protein C1X59_29455 [Pseudomonas sp. FW215-R2]|nr:hypothetical protein C1X59_29455 [Pseudomonas sp. FW215-R2]PMX04919.1 hypothetical protein C1X60_29420 [Pseudomonas sp. FW215-L1]PMX16443.1 hypothetical protein C1X57_29225 [Pseudomonas sp. FW215-E1]PNA20823.1 hypothetical protein C1X58_29340 [Pseudomonas sp. FW215-R4]
MKGKRGIVPTSRRRTVRVGMPQWTLRVRFGRDAERPGLHSHAERGNDQGQVGVKWITSASRPSCLRRSSSSTPVPHWSR